MMYSNNFAAAIICSGKVLREFGDTVYLPFGSEYKIRLKNLNSSRAKVKVEIDGECVTDGGLVIGSKQTLDLERFIRNGNLDQGNRFKFIERSQKIEQYRGVKVDDGIISISYEFELAPLPLISNNTSYRGYSPRVKGISNTVMDCAWSDVGPTNVVSSSLNCAPTASLNSSIPVNDAGITVEGSLSNQSFSTTFWRGTIGGVNVMNIRLLGETEANSLVRQAVTVKTKAKCKTCGTVNKATAKFCGECGTSLSLY